MQLREQVRSLLGTVSAADPKALASTIAHSALGGILGGSAAAIIVVLVTEAIKVLLGVISRQQAWVLILMPLIGLALSVLVLYGFGLSSETPASQRPRWAAAWRTFPPGAIRSDLTGDLIDTAGREERFPWRLAPIRLLAIYATVGLGAAMGTEKPAVYFGVATGAALGDRWWPRLLRPMAVAGGAAGVAVLMGIPLVGTVFILELERRHHARLSVERVTAALVGGLVGWLWYLALGVDLIRLVVPRQPPNDLFQALMTAVLIGLLSGSITSAASTAIYRAKYWRARPVIRLAIGGLGLATAAVLLLMIASPSAAIGPGGGAITWVESTREPALTVLAVCLLRTVATTASSAVGGCGGLFVPFLAIGDLGGRVFARALDLPADLAGAAGAASGISGGYHLPFTAVALVLGQGGSGHAMLTCLATVVVAAYAGTGTAYLLDLILPGRSPHPVVSDSYTF